MNIHRLIGIACLALTGIVGCTVGNAPESEGAPEMAESQSNVVRVSAEQIAALAPGEVLRLDLTDREAVYDVEFFDAADLDQVIVVSASGEHKLSEKLPNAKPGERGRLVLAADSILAQEYTDSMTATATPGPTADGVGEAVQELRGTCIDIYDFGDIIIIIIYACDL